MTRIRPPRPRVEPKDLFRKVIVFILITELCERFSYYGVASSLTIFLKKQLGFSSLLASEISALFSAFSFLCPLVGAWLADTKLGRYRTIKRSMMLYCAGLTLAALGAIPEHESAVLFLAGLFGGVALGAGGIKPNTVVFGGDQFDEGDPGQVRMQQSYFSYFYLCINAGAIISYALLPYIAANGLGLISEDWGFFASYAIPCAVFYTGTAVFVGGRRRYRKKRPRGSVLADFLGVVRAAARQSAQGRRVVLGAALQAPAVALVVAGFFITDEGLQQATAVTGMALIVAGVLLVMVNGRTTEWLELAGGESKTVRDAAEVIRMLPFLGHIVGFWAVYAAMPTLFVLQACAMDLRVAGVGELSAASLLVCDAVVILVGIPVVEKWFYPWLQRRGRPMTLMAKIGWGFVLCTAAMVAAAVVEVLRRRAPLLAGVESQCNDDDGALVSDLAVWAQVPQITLVGLAEIFTSVGAYELFYTNVPVTMRSVCQSLNLLSVTLGFMVTGAINSIFKAWIPDDLNDGRLELVFLFMAALELVNVVGFVHLAKTFKAKVPEHDSSLFSRAADRSVGRASERSVGRSSGRQVTPLPEQVQSATAVQVVPRLQSQPPTEEV